MFQIVKYEASDLEHAQYNGRIAIVLPWSANNDEPFSERYVTITNMMADDYPNYVKDPPVQEYDVAGNRIFFSHHTWYKPVVVDTTGMIQFTERVPVSPPRSVWNKRGERKKYRWSWGRWIQDGWDYREER